MGSVYVLVRDANDRDLASASETLTRREYQGAASLPPPSEAELQSFFATSSGIVAGELIRRGNRDDLMPLLLEMGIDRIDALPLEYLLAIEYAGGDTRAGMEVLLDLADLAHDTRYEPVAAAMCYRAFAGVVNPGVKASELSGSALAGYIARCRSWLASHHNDLQIREEYPLEMWAWAGGEPPKMLYITSGS